MRSQLVRISHFLYGSEELSRPNLIGLRQGIEARADLYRFQLNRTNSTDALDVLTHSSRIACISCVGRHPRNLLEKFEKRDMPLVLADPGQPILDLDYVGADVETATRDIFDWHAERKVLHPAIVGIPLSNKSNETGRRHRGYMRWMKEHARYNEASVKSPNMPGDDLAKFVHEVFSGQTTELKAYGLIVNADRQVGQACRALAKLGLKIPNDVAVVGFNDSFAA